MDILQRIKNFISPKGVSWTDWAFGTKVTDDYLYINSAIGMQRAFLSIPIIAGIIQKIQNAFLNGKIYVENSKGEFVEDTEVQKFFENNVTFLKEFVKELTLHKQVVIRKFKTIGSVKLYKLEILPLHLLTVNVDNYQIINYNYTNEAQLIPAAECEHLFISQPIFSQTSYSVANELYSIEQAINTLLTAYRVRITAQEQNGGQFILSKELSANPEIEYNTRLISEEDQDSVQKQLSRFGNKRSQYSMLVTKTPWRVQPMVFPINTMALTEGIENSIKDVARAFNIPLPLVIDSASTYNNVKSVQKELYTENVMLLWKMLELFVNQTFELQKQNLTFKIDYFGVEALQSDKKQEYETKNIETQTIINLNNEVYNGSMERETALFILQDTYNYSIENSEKLITNGKRENNTNTKTGIK